MKTEEDFETDEEYEEHLAAQIKLWEAQEPFRQELQRMLVEGSTQLERLADELDERLVAYAEQHGLSFQFNRGAEHREYISARALEIGLNENGDPFKEGDYTMYEYDEPGEGWNSWVNSNC